MKKPEPSDYELTKNDINKFTINKFNYIREPIEIIVLLGAFIIWYYLGFWAFILLLLGFYGLEYLIQDAIRNSHRYSHKYQKFLEYQNSMKNYDLYIEGEKQRIRKEIREEEERKAKIIKQKKVFWQNLTGREFEKEMAILFRDSGFDVILTPTVADGGIDIILKKDNKKIIVQCKAHKNPVAIATAREVYGALVHCKANEAILVSVSGFTSGVKTFVKNKPIKLMDLDGIIKNKLPCC